MKPSCWTPLVLGTALLASGCSSLDVPRADNYPVSGQKKARSVHHWDVLADDSARRIADKIRSYPMALPAVYVVPAATGTFNQSFRELLLTRLVDHGAIVSRQPGPLVVRFETQLIEHASEVDNRNPMPALSLAAGISVVRDLYAYDHVTGNYVGSLLSLGAITDLSRRWREGTAAGGPTRTEVLITTSLEREDTFLARTADVYYIDGEDGGLYVPKPVKAADAGPPPVATRTWTVVGP